MGQEPSRKSLAGKAGDLLIMKLEQYKSRANGSNLKENNPTPYEELEVNHLRITA